jgi:hypothetical protein
MNCVGDVLTNVEIYHAFYASQKVKSGKGIKELDQLLSAACNYLANYQLIRIMTRLTPHISACVVIFHLRSKLCLHQ